ncbi:MAG TPA: MTH1187 family thiamine-binding protein [Syntrophorhabdales bacterium]|nr:MTH1187 family thiamine-binding protein [Syntrophorhabdales bacterium]
MSVLLELTMFPTDKGESVSPYVSRIIAMIDDRGVDYRLTPMGTIMEFARLDEALKVVADAYALLEPDCARVYGTMKLDIRKGKEGRLTQKIESVEKKIGRKVRT